MTGSHPGAASSGCRMIQPSLMCLCRSSNGQHGQSVCCSQKGLAASCLQCSQPLGIAVVPMATDTSAPCLGPPHLGRTPLAIRLSPGNLRCCWGRGGHSCTVLPCCGGLGFWLVQHGCLGEVAMWPFEGEISTASSSSAPLDGKMCHILNATRTNIWLRRRDAVLP